MFPLFARFFACSCLSTVLFLHVSELPYESVSTPSVVVYLLLFLASSTQAIPEEGALIENMPPSYWPVGLLVNG